MKHAPATIKGRRRRIIVFIAENVLGMSFLFGVLYLFCAFASFVLALAGV